MPTSTPTVLFEDNHVLVVSKPAGLLVQGDSSGEPNLLDWAKSHRKRNENKPGNVFVGLVHRLDRNVSGVVVLAKTSKSASRLSDQFRNRMVEKKYWAVCESSSFGAAIEGTGVWKNWLEKDQLTNRVSVSKTQDGLLAITRWRLIESADSLAFLELSPETGRPHQLRVQCSVADLPIVGDRKYGAKLRLASDEAFGIALHAVSLQFAHPTKQGQMQFVAPVPTSWQCFPFRFTP